VELRDQGIGRVVTESRSGGGEVARRAGGGGPPVLGEELLRLGDLAGQSVGGVPLPLPHEGSRTDALLSRGGHGPGGNQRGSEGGGGPRSVEGGRRRGREVEGTLGAATHARPLQVWRRTVSTSGKGRAWRGERQCQAGCSCSGSVGGRCGRGHVGAIIRYRRSLGPGGFGGIGREGGGCGSSSVIGGESQGRARSRGSSGGTRRGKRRSR
jgi:hypothetical protein